MRASTGILSIDLDAIVANWRALRARAAPAETSAVIKANAYGLGARPVGATLYRAGCRSFFFATVQEAADARDYLPFDARCFVLGAVADVDAPEMFAQQLSPVLSSLPALRQWGVWRQKHKSNAPGCALKFNTGMARMGLSEAELLSLGEEKQLLAGLDVGLVMSHLASSDEPASKQNRSQLESFQAVRRWLAPLLPGAQWSLANSSGIFLGVDYHADLVRPGAAIYGFNPLAELPSPVVPVVSLSLPVIQVRRLACDSPVGYGATAHRAAGTVLGVAAGGYADGVHRVLGDQGFGFCRGTRVPVVGRVSMDSTVFDLSQVPDLLDEQGEVVGDDLQIEVLGGCCGLSEISRRNRSLGYEVLTSLGAGRYRRNYRGGES